MYKRKKHVWYNNTYKSSVFLVLVSFVVKRNVKFTVQFT